jgi:hypothetical protein
VGLTDLAKGAVASTDRRLSRFDVPGFVDKMARYQPAWVAFHGKRSAKEVSRHLGFGRDVSLGLQHWRITDRPVFVCHVTADLRMLTVRVTLERSSALRSASTFARSRFAAWLRRVAPASAATPLFCWQAKE